MIPLREISEQSFGKMEALRDAIAAQDRKVYEAPLRDVSLSKEGVLHAGRFEGPLTKPAFHGLVRTEGAPPEFVVDRCPDDLQVTIVRSLAQGQNRSVRIQTVDGVATGVMPADWHPLRCDVLVDRLGVDRTIEEAVLSADCLRITALIDEPRELLPNDSFRSGWELITSENGWYSTRVVRRVVREVCTNGLMGIDETAVFERKYNSRESVLASLQRLVHALAQALQPLELESAVRWATQTVVGNERELVVGYLSRRLGGDVTKRELSVVTPDASWYELLNAVTAAAQLHNLDLRRRYEVAGGVLTNWFARQGRTRPPWRRASCEGCEDWNVGSAEAGTSRDMVTQRDEQIRE
jgi:hypothetical protein